MQRIKILLLLLLGDMVIAAPETLKEGNLYKIYGVNLEKFLKAHPITLFALHDRSAFSEQVIETLDKLQPVLAEEGFTKLRIAKMEDRSAPRWVHLWRADDKPFLRLYVGDGLFTDLKHFPSFKNIHEWVTKALSASKDIIEITDDDIKKQFKREELAFYMRFPANQTHYLSLLRNFRRLDPRIKVYYTTNRMFDAFDKFRPNDIVVGIQRNFDDGLKVMAHDKKVTTDTVQRFFDIYRTPDVQEANSTVIDEILSKKRRTVVLFQKGEKDELYKDFKDTAFKNKESFLFVHADPETETGRQLLEAISLEEADLPAIRVVHYANNQFGTFEVQLGNEEELSEQLNQFLKAKSAEAKTTIPVEIPEKAVAGNETKENGYVTGEL